MTVMRKHVLFPFLLAAAVPLLVMAQGPYPPNGSTIPTVALNGSSPAIQEP